MRQPFLSFYAARRKAIKDGQAIGANESTARGTCNADGCARTVLSRGFCGAHYQRFRKYGDATTRRALPPRYPQPPKAQQMREWRQRNPARWKAIAAAAKVLRRARRYDAGAEAFNRDRLFVRDRGLCAYCGLGLDPANWHLDHVVPLTKGGAHTKMNSVAACPDCNRRKGDLDAAMFRASMGA
jgi:5-methylcytosine-specific restriction endonuclease McrA